MSLTKNLKRRMKTQQGLNEDMLILNKIFVFFRSALKERLAKTRDELPQGLMREVLETYKPNLLTRRRRLVLSCIIYIYIEYVCCSNLLIASAVLT